MSEYAGGVVVGVDGTPGGAGALRYAVVEARRRRVPLHLVHVLADGLNVVPAVAPQVLRGAGQGVLDTAMSTARELGPDLDLTGQLLVGRRSDAIVSVAKDAELLVLGRETRKGVDRLLTGTTTAAATAHAACDVVVVPSFWTGDHVRGRVVVGVRSVHDAGDVAARGLAEAAWRGVGLEIVTAWHLPDAYLDKIEARSHGDEWVDAGMADLKSLLQPLRASFPDVDVQLRVVHGRPAAVLLDAAADSELLILTRRHAAVPPHERFGGVGRAVLRLSDVPVLVVPSSRTTEADHLVLEGAGAP